MSMSADRTGPRTGPLPGTTDAWAAADVAAADSVRLATGADLMAVASAGLAHACAAALRERLGRVSGTRVVLLVGAGNNGGDALHAGALLRRRGVGVTALLSTDRHHGAGAAALARAGGRLVAVPATGRPEQLPEAVARLLGEADLVVDGLLGIGSSGAPRGTAGALLAAVGTTVPRPAVVVACDLPSGLDPGTGRTAGDVLAADLTVTFGVAKPGLLLPGSQHLVGRLVVVDLGLRAHLPATPALQRLVVGGLDQPSPLVRRLWPWPWRAADKYARGVLGVVAGEAQYAGAAVLTSSAAVAAGSGMVRFLPPAGEPEVGQVVQAAVPEVVVQPLPGTGRVQAWVVGPGTSDDDDARVTHVLTGTDEPAVVDAGALAALARAHRDGILRRGGDLLLTPHAGELDRLVRGLDLPPVDEDRGLGGVSAARSVADLTGATVLLKGPDTVVVAPGHPPVVVPGGPPSLATAGAGDVLAGIAGSLLAAGLIPRDAGILAAHVHAVAAHRAAGGGPLRASVVAAAVPGVLASAHLESWDHG
jgi:ADP-dependent NAD(P)H-hydrate dehydratase / NAD(P)H-hydrate epimerase